MERDIRQDWENLTLDEKRLDLGLFIQKLTVNSGPV
jgi:hypothetical protein